MGMLFEQCEKCKGTRLSEKGGTCLACRGEGYHATGLTTGQVERLFVAERVRLGDPPAVERAMRQVKAATRED